MPNMLSNLQALKLLGGNFRVWRTHLVLNELYISLSGIYFLFSGQRNNVQKNLLCHVLWNKWSTFTMCERRFNTEYRFGRKT